MTVSSEAYKNLLDDLKEGENTLPIHRTDDADQPGAQAHHKEGVKHKALKMMRLLYEVAVLGNAGAYAEYCQQVQQIMHTKVQLALSVYIVTRCPTIFPFLTSLTTNCITKVRSANTAADRAQARKAFNAIWLFVARLLTNNYSLDIRILICEHVQLIGALLPACLDPRVYLDCEQANQSLISKLSKTLDVFGLSPYWSTFLTRDETEKANILNALLSSIDTSLANYRQDPMNGLLGLAESLRIVLMLSVVSEEFCLSLSKDCSVTPRIVSLVLTIADFSDLEWAVLNLLWLAEMTSMGFPNTTASLGPSDDTDMVHLTLPVLISGHCLTLLHVVGRSSGGAMHLAASGGQTLRAIKKFVNIHSEDLLKKTGLWPMVVALIPSCSLGVTTSCNDPSLISVRRLKHYNILLPCTCCSKVAIGSRQLKICGECHLIRYCGRECQQNDWQDGHNTLCKHFLTMK